MRRFLPSLRTALACGLLVLAVAATWQLAQEPGPSPAGAEQSGRMKTGFQALRDDFAALLALPGDGAALRLARASRELLPGIRLAVRDGERPGGVARDAWAAVGIALADWERLAATLLAGHARHERDPLALKAATAADLPLLEERGERVSRALDALDVRLAGLRAQRETQPPGRRAAAWTALACCLAGAVVLAARSLRGAPRGSEHTEQRGRASALPAFPEDVPAWALADGPPPDSRRPGAPLPAPGILGEFIHLRRAAAGAIQALEARLAEASPRGLTGAEQDSLFQAASTLVSIVEGLTLASRDVTRRMRLASGAPPLQ